MLRKGNKHLEDASSYRSICLLDTMGKCLEEMILQIYRVTWSARTAFQRISSAFGKAGPQLTSSMQLWTSLLRQEEELVSVRDSTPDTMEPAVREVQSRKAVPQAVY